MALLDALLGIGRAIISGLQSFTAGVVVEIVREIDRSPIGKVVAQGLSAFSGQFLITAKNLAEEEAELAEKARRDGKTNEADLERRHDIATERETLRKNFEAAKAREAAEKLKNSEVLSAPVTPDEISSIAGIVTLNKDCPSCGAPMRIRQGGYNANSATRRFWWQCTRFGPASCPSIRLDPETYAAKVIRPANPDLDGPEKRRREVWTDQKTLVQTHGRLRSHLGDDDVEMVCPHHVLPMKLVQRRGASGRMLDSYEYVCTGIGTDGRACDHAVALETFPQVAEALRRAEGAGIVRS